MEKSLHFSGTGFSPRKLKELTKLPINIIVESGENGTRGLYKGKPCPYGIGYILFKTQDELNEIYSVLNESKSVIEESKLSEVKIDYEPLNEDIPFLKYLVKEEEI